jgi:hypothetical protein
LLEPLGEELIRAGDAVVVIDLKGQMSQFETMRLAAKRYGRTFKYFTNVLGRSSYICNPYTQVNSATTSLTQFVETIMESLRLNHGDGYGSRFFSSQSREWLLKTVNKLLLRQARSFGLSLILANQSESDLMSREMSRLLDVVRANTQVKVYLSVNDPNTTRMLEQMSGVIGYVRESGLVDYRPRLTASDIRYYSSHPDLAICWITRDSGFTAHGGELFGLRTSHAMSWEEHQRRESAAWPAPTPSTIVARRDDAGAVAFAQGKGAASNTDDEPKRRVSPSLSVSHDDSQWAKRLNEIHAVGKGRRSHEEGRCCRCSTRHTWLVLLPHSFRNAFWPSYLERSAFQEGRSQTRRTG